MWLGEGRFSVYLRLKVKCVARKESAISFSPIHLPNLCFPLSAKPHYQGSECADFFRGPWTLSINTGGSVSFLAGTLH